VALGIEIPEEKDAEQDVVEINIDPYCLYDSRKDGNKASSLWYNKESFVKFQEFFTENCYYKSSCNFDSE
jgi:hypothetical protein